MNRKLVLLLLCLVALSAIHCYISIVQPLGDPIDDPTPHCLGDPIDDPTPHCLGDPIDDPTPHCLGDPIDDPKPHRC
ncbi:MAG: hypothetical protein ACFE7A_06085 [Promethearchaeota archaeon]